MPITRKHSRQLGVAIKGVLLSVCMILTLTTISYANPIPTLPDQPDLAAVTEGLGPLDIETLPPGDLVANNEPPVPPRRSGVIEALESFDNFPVRMVRSVGDLVDGALSTTTEFITTTLPDPVGRVLALVNRGVHRVGITIDSDSVLDVADVLVRVRQDHSARVEAAPGVRGYLGAAWSTAKELAATAGYLGREFIDVATGGQPKK